MTMMLTPLPGLPLVQSGDDLQKMILEGLTRVNISLQDGDILVLAQKIVSKAEGRMVRLADVTPGARATELAEATQKDARLVELILGESKEVVRFRPGLIVVEHRLGFVCANAGIDHSNVSEGDDCYLLLPEDPDGSAGRLRTELEAASGARLGAAIIDSHGRAWRTGTAGVVIGLSGLPGLVDLRGQEDLFGYELQFSEVGAADELAAAASLVMGQAAEGTPVVHVRGFPYALREASLSELLRDKERDMFR